jgi:transposase-like protein
MVQEYQVALVLVVETCSNCGCLFGLPERWVAQLRREGGKFFCPNGHSLSYPKYTEVERLKKQLDAERRRSEYLSNLADAERRGHSATKGKLTKLKNRVGAGVCPCCNRTFQDLQRHMLGQHPDFRREEV